MDICCIGDLCADLLLPYGEVKQHLRNLKSGNVDYSEVLFQYGGTAGNTCAVLGKLGSRPYFVSDLCGDRIGRYLSQSMRDLGVNLSWSLENPEKANMICVAVIDENNERVIFPWLPPGSGYPTFSRKNLALIPRRKMLVFTGGMVMNNDPSSMSAVSEVLEELKAAGSVIVFDLNVRSETYGMNRVRKAAYERMVNCADLILGSPEEFAAITGKQAGQASVMPLCGKGKTVIVRGGSEPVRIYEHGFLTEVPVEKVSVFHSIGAGDTFNAAFLHAMNQGCTCTQATQFANGIAGYMISHPGQLSIPADAEERLEKIRNTIA